MPYPRYRQIDHDQTPYYHLISRCVRRAFLCGVDYSTGQSYEHRKGWVEARLIHLSKVFSVGILAYAVMENHTHLVVMINQKQAAQLSDAEVMRRWLQVSNGCAKSKRFAETGTYPDKETEVWLKKHVNEYRKRLTSISWLMKLLNEYIARKANKEDECTGHFWEGRYKSQALLDFTAVISCMVYVDLNPFRAKAVKKPEYAKFTSLHKRSEAFKKGCQPHFLTPFLPNRKKANIGNIDFSLDQYLKLVSETASSFDSTDASEWSKSLDPFLDKISVNPKEWLETTQNVENMYSIALGSCENLDLFKKSTGRTRLKGAVNSLKLYKACGLKTH